MLDDCAPNFEIHDLRAMPLSEGLAQIDGLRERYAHTLFDLKTPPWNVTAFRLWGGETVLFARFDALVLDGRAIATLMAELLGDSPASISLPSKTKAAQTKAPPPPERHAIDAAYWQRKLAHIRGSLRLPWLQPLEQISTSRYRRQSRHVPKPILTEVSAAGARKGFFQNTTLTAILLEVLTHWAEGGDLCVGIPVAPLTGAALANRSGFLAIGWQTQGPLAARAAQLQSDILTGMKHNSFSGIEIARQLFESHGSGPVLPVVITNAMSWPQPSPESGMRPCSGLTQTPQVAMDLRLCKTPEGDLVIDIDYATAALDEVVIGAILDALERAMQAIAQSGEFALRPVDRIDPWHGPAQEGCAPAEPPFLRRIAANLFDPANQRIALISGAERITYAALGQTVLRYIDGLRAQGVDSGKTLAICLHRGVEHTALVLACALCGIRWVPVDAQSPAERLAYLLTNCRPDLVVCMTRPAITAPVLRPMDLLSPEAAPQPSPAALDALAQSAAPAYLLYTSGTTGRPKCVALSNAATENVIARTLRDWRITPADVFISVTPLHHDMSVFDVLGCLTAGGCLILPEIGEEKNAVRWCQLVAEHGVTIWCSVPAILEMLLACQQNDDLASLRLVAQGGDYIKPQIIAELRRLLPDARLISLGGPTETTIWSIWHEIGPEDVGAVPYGRAVAGNAYLLLTEAGALTAAGVLGRMHVTGANLALGYLQDGALAQTDFVTVTTPQGHEARAFRTGDLGRYREDGTILFAGRVDGYIKIRGVRVSLPDIEAALQAHPAVKALLVIEFGEARSGEAAIGVVYVPQIGERLSPAMLRDHARSLLPASHIPSLCVQAREIALSPNGKPDRARARALLQPPDPVTTDPTTTERKIRAIYAEVLPQEAASRLDHTACLHGLGLRPHHLKVVAPKLAAAFGIDLQPRQMLALRTLDDVAAMIGRLTV